ncbi:sulfatase-like hydrolase/transferase [Antarctobacter sp.]|uniref:sulfatase-like hydrolase/transferase n=1 Tax=Antarctobacter sp. TaxID=1872577 RepID=UPI002B267783|nr:sulfatase-like hydrolase/transferase [Antarctobacter sp.]
MSLPICMDPAKAGCGEGLLWDPGREYLWWTDFSGERLHRFDPRTGASSDLPMPYLISALALDQTGGLLIASARGLGRVDPKTGDMRRLHDPEPEIDGNRLNDMIAGPDRTLWIGTMSEGAKGATGALDRYERGIPAPMMTGTTISNGLPCTPSSAPFLRKAFAMNRKPNVILISTDQHRGDCIGPEGRGVRTPNIDRIGTNVVRFSNCIAPHPMCQAARASILTGKLPYSHGVRDNGRDLDKTLAKAGLGGLFGKAGYATHFIGKAHLSSQQTFAPTGRPECYKSAKDFAPDWRGSYMGFDNVQMMLRPHHHTQWYDPPEALHHEYWLDQGGHGQDRWDRAKVRLTPDTDHFQAWRSGLEAPWHSSPWIRDRAVEMIRNKGAEPLMAWVSFPDPHPPFLAPQPWCDMYGPDDVTIAKHSDLDLDKRPWWHRAFVEDRTKPIKQGAEHNAGGVDWGQKGDLTESALRDITRIYFGMISCVDYEVGRILHALEEAGELDDTYVIFISDHGEWLGDHRLLLKGPMMYDGLLRVPCLIQGPDVPSGRVINDPVGSVDVLATAADMAGLDAAGGHGRSWRGLWTGAESRDFALSEYGVDSLRSAVDMDLMTVRSAGYRMSMDLRTQTGELYDLQDDPQEKVNRFEDPDFVAIRREHHDMIRSRPDDMIPAAPRVGWH